MRKNTQNIITKRKTEDNGKNIEFLITSYLNEKSYEFSLPLKDIIELIRIGHKFYTNNLEVGNIPVIIKEENGVEYLLSDDDLNENNINNLPLDNTINAKAWSEKDTKAYYTLSLDACLDSINSGSESKSQEIVDIHLCEQFLLPRLEGYISDEEYSNYEKIISELRSKLAVSIKIPSLYSPIKMGRFYVELDGEKKPSSYLFDSYKLHYDNLGTKITIGFKHNENDSVDYKSIVSTRSIQIHLLNEFGESVKTLKYRVVDSQLKTKNKYTSEDKLLRGKIIFKIVEIQC